MTAHPGVLVFLSSTLTFLALTASTAQAAGMRDDACRHLNASSTAVSVPEIDGVTLSWNQDTTNSDIARQEHVVITDGPRRAAGHQRG
jgi:hypothetical protein